ncbi:hypothetical protein BKA56DRAFT_610688 [Ilyonectria sp. MPI-CAGE-AT-0026]|nr:hypothetical protein BKA56DRAFT_610688 [Ilyonectria sp. MPI-CAGE-AT-0026]
MPQAASISNTRIESRNSRRRVRSGCGTCRIRKVKCDEGRPACHRCISTGRACDGYGIWGGGSNSSVKLQQSHSASQDVETVVARPLAPLSVLVATTSEEKYYFTWFKSQAMHKFSGAFASKFWNTLILQMGFREPAVLHAVLALSSVHRRGVVINTCEQRDIKDTLYEQEQFALQSYVKAIRHLQPHFSVKDRTSFRVALATCLVFIAVELLRGHFQAAISHLQNGLKVLQDAELSVNVDDRNLRLKSGHELADDWIVETFSVLQFQAELFSLSYHGPFLIPPVVGHKPGSIMPQSLDEAWQQMQRLLNEILHLAQTSCEEVPESESHLPPHTLLELQQHIRADLERWLYMYENLRKSLHGHMSYDENKRFTILSGYHTMAKIMLEVCLCPGNESIFDSHTTQFVFLVSTLSELCAEAGTYLPTRLCRKLRPGNFVDMAHSYVDVGWLPPLYYTAIKCRIHRVRLQAIRLIEISSHREGIWDAETTACIARKVMEIEERDFYRGVDIDDEFPLSSCPTPRDLSLPLIPDSYRIHGLEVVLHGDPMESIFLFREPNQEGRTGKVLISEYNISSQCWVDR